jgi:hypothetical protein
MGVGCCCFDVSGISSARAAGWLLRPAALAGGFETPLMVEVWLALLLYGGGVMDDLKLLRGRGIRRLFGWTRIPDPTTFGRWLRRAGDVLPEESWTACGGCSCSVTGSGRECRGM